MCALFPSPRHPDPLGGGERVPTGMMRESMRSLENIYVKNLGRVNLNNLPAGANHPINEASEASPPSRGYWS